jgi:uncharacterized sulfatase
MFSRRSLLLVAALLAHGICLGAATAERPNIVFIISDDHAWTDYGFMGHPQIETPHLDRLAHQGALFERGYVPTALCRPALATLANGLYAHQHRIVGNDPTLLPGMSGAAKQRQEPPEYKRLREQLISRIDQHPTVAKLLGEQGYLSHQSGKWWEGSYRRGGFTHGMTRGFPETGGRHGDDGLTIGRRGMKPIFDFIDHAVAEKKPFFVWYAPFMPHTPHTPPERLFAKYKAKGVASDFVARYYAMVEWFDETCGQLLDRLEEKGLTRNTLVVYVADNGWIQKRDANGFAPRSKQSAHEGGVRQPIIFRWPGTIQPGRRSAELCSSIDIVPTALAAAAVTPPASLPGLNLLPVLRAGQPSVRAEVFGETFAHDIPDLENPQASLVHRWIVADRWKLLLTYDGEVSARYADANPRPEPRPQLFDLAADPHETRNLAAQHPERVADLAARIARWWPAPQRKVLTTWSPE